MNTTIDIYLGAPLAHESEKVFLSRLCADLKSRGQSAVIFGNFMLSTRQIDFLVVTASCVCHVELKAITRPVKGLENGLWSLVEPDGSLIEMDRENPYRQALECKFQISDLMHFLARRDPNPWQPAGGAKFYKVFESVVCVYPEVLPGSSVPSDKKVRTLGYSKLVDLLLTATPKCGWERKDWIAFALHLGLIAQVEGESPKTREVAECRRLVDAYARRFEEFHGVGLARSVPISVKRDGEIVPSDSLHGLLAEGRHAQLIGQSGAGKSYLARQMAIQAIAAGHLPVLVPAKQYDGKLSDLLNRAVAHLHPNSFSDLLRLASTICKPMVLIMDGTNECPVHLAPQFVKDLQASYLRWKLPIAFTAQSEFSLPAELRGDVLVLQDLTDEQRDAIVAAYAPEVGRLPTGAAELFASCRTAFELSLAAECLSSAPTTVSRADVFERYARACCSESAEYPAMKRVLSELADIMQRRLESRVTTTEAWAIATQVATEERIPLTVMQKLLGCRLLEMGHENCSFRHELWQRFFEAHAVIRRFRSPSLLASEIRKPRFREIADLVIAMQFEPEPVRECLEALADSALLAAGLRGTLGNLPRELVLADAKALLVKAATEIPEVTCETRETADPNVKWPHLVVKAGCAWSDYERALMGAIGECLHDGILFEDVRRLAAAVWNEFVTALGEKQARKLASELFSGLFVLIGGNCPAVSAITHACQQTFLRKAGAAAVAQAVAMLQARQGIGPTDLYLCCVLLRHSGGDAVSVTADLLSASWQSRVYHVCLQALELVTWWSSEITGETRDRAVAILESFESRGPFLDTSVVEALAAFGVVECALDVSHAANEIDAILQNPDDRESQDAAYSAVCNIFEDVFQGIYYEAIEALEKGDRTRLLTMAALGAPPYAMFADWILRELVQCESAGALPAFVRWTNEIYGGTHVSQDATNGFLTGYVGCAQFLDSPPRHEERTAPAQAAWQAYGEIIFWLHKPGLPGQELVAKCGPLWELLKCDIPFDAVDPLYCFELATRCGSDRSEHPFGKMIQRFGDEVRSILEFGIRHPEKLTSIDGDRAKWPRDRIERAQFVIRTLGKVGNAQTIRLIEPLVDSEDVGSCVMDAIKELKKKE